MNTRLVSQAFLGEDSDRVLNLARIAIVGLSGGGSHLAQQMAHLGAGDFVVVDFDHVEFKNLNRMVGATARDARLSTLKTTVIRRVIKRVNPTAKVIAVSKRWQEDAEVLRDCDLICGCVDTFSDRQQLEAAARRYLIPYLDLGMDVSPIEGGFSIGGQVALSVPDGPCLQCFGILNDERLKQEAARYGAAGSRPQVVWANGVLASAAVGIAVQLLCPWNSRDCGGTLLEYDGDSHLVSVSNKMKYLEGVKCAHFSTASSLGDPFFPQVKSYVSPAA